jgi:hypothetical protein
MARNVSFAESLGRTIFSAIRTTRRRFRDDHDACRIVGESMKAAVNTRNGSPDALEIRDISKPEGRRDPGQGVCHDGRWTGDGTWRCRDDCTATVPAH